MGRAGGARSGAFWRNELIWEIAMESMSHTAHPTPRATLLRRTQSAARRGDFGGTKPPRENPALNLLPVAQRNVPQRARGEQFLDLDAPRRQAVLVGVLQ